MRSFAMGGFIAVLVAFFCWAVFWSVGDREQSVYGLPGATTVFSTTIGPEAVASTANSRASDEIIAALHTAHVSLVVASAGDGVPELLVDDSGDRLPWARALSSATPGDVYVIHSSFSARQWTNDAKVSLLPNGARVIGSVDPGTPVGDLQFIRPLAGSPVAVGSYVLGSTDPALISKIEDSLSRAGMQVQGTQPRTTLSDVTHNSLVNVTAAFLAAGALCAVGAIILITFGRQNEAEIRRIHGATGRALIVRWWGRTLPALLAGSVVGVAITGASTRIIGAQGLSPAELITLAFAVALSMLISTLLWAAAVIGSVAGMTRSSSRAR